MWKSEMDRKCVCVGRREGDRDKEKEIIIDMGNILKEKRRAREEGSRERERVALQ